MHDQSEPPGSPWRAALCAALFVAGGAYHLRALRYENGALRRAQAGKTAELALLRASDDRRFESYRAHVDALRTRHPRRRGNATAEHVPVGILVRTFAGDLQWLAYCLRSVAKFALPYVDGVTVVFPEADDATVGAFVRLAHPWARTNVSTSAAVFAAAMRAAHPHKFARCHAGQCLPDCALAASFYSLRVVVGIACHVHVASMAPRATPSTRCPTQTRRRSSTSSAPTSTCPLLVSFSTSTATRYSRGRSPFRTSSIRARESP